MYSAPHGIRRALDELASAFRSENLRVSVIVLESNNSDATENRVGGDGLPQSSDRSQLPSAPAQASGSAGKSSSVRGWGAIQPPSQKEVTSSSSAAPFRRSPSGELTTPGPYADSTQAAHIHDKSATQASTAMGGIHASQQQEEHVGSRPLPSTVEGQSDAPWLLVLDKVEASQTRNFLQTLGSAANISVPSSKIVAKESSPFQNPGEGSGSSQLSRPKRTSVEIPRDRKSSKRTRVVESNFTSRPISMPALSHPGPSAIQTEQTSSQQPYSGQRPEAGVPKKFWGTVLTQAGHPSRDLPDREVESAGSVFASNPVARSLLRRHFQERILTQQRSSSEVERLHQMNPAISSEPSQTHGADMSGDRENLVRKAGSSQPSGSVSEEPRVTNIDASAHVERPRSLQAARADASAAGAELEHRDEHSGASGLPKAIQGYQAGSPPQSRTAPASAAPRFSNRGHSLSSLPPLTSGGFQRLPSRPASQLHIGVPSSMDHEPMQGATQSYQQPRPLPSLVQLQQPTRSPLTSSARTYGSEEVRNQRLQGRDQRLQVLDSQGSMSVSHSPRRRDTVRTAPQERSAASSVPSTAVRSPITAFQHDHPGQHGPAAGPIVPLHSPVTGTALPPATSGNQFSCSLCEGTFRRKSDMNRHIRVVHEKRRPFVCPTCNNRFGEKSNMIKHVRMVHQNIRTFHCPHCNAAFGQRGNCEAHVRAVHEKRPGKYQCEVCRRAFSRKAQLLDHYSQEHPGIPAPVSRSRSRGGGSSSAPSILVAGAPTVRGHAATNIESNLRSMHRQMPPVVQEPQISSNIPNPSAIRTQSPYVGRGASLPHPTHWNAQVRGESYRGTPRPGPAEDQRGEVRYQQEN